jgi:hypothetical protein
MMKVEGPKKSTPAKGASKTGAAKGTGDASFSGMIEDTDETPAQKPVSGVMQISQLDALLSIQESGGSTSEEAAKKGRQRAALLLAQLDQLRIGILSGGIPRSTLQQLGRTISTHRDNVMDPQLAELLDEIDLRVQVELAKHGG